MNKLGLCIILLTVYVRAEVDSVEGTASVYETRARFQAPLVPIVLVPGFGGSVLYNDNGRLWATTNPNYDCRPLLNLSDPSIYPPSNDYGLYSINMLGSNGLFSGAPYFRDMINSLVEIGYVPGKDLFGFPYDWRFAPDNRKIFDRFDRLMWKLKPIVIAHSMGGLLVEEYFKIVPRNPIRRVVTISTPFKGAGGNALKAFLTGYNLGNDYFTDASLMKRLAKEFYSSYWLLPQPNLKPQPKIISQPAMEYLLPSIHLYPERYSVRKSPKILDTNVYYLTTDQVATPYDYDHTTNYFTTTKGDGTVPLQSSLHSAEHGQPESHEIIVNTLRNHMEILGSSNLFGVLLDITDNWCNYLGTYKSSSNNYIYVKYREYNHDHYEYYASDLYERQEYTPITWYRDCTTIEYNSVKYYRQLGSECTGYILYDHVPADSYEYRHECVYGTIRYSNQSWCSDVDLSKYTCRRDYLKSRTIIDPIPEPPPVAAPISPPISEPVSIPVSSPVAVPSDPPVSSSSSVQDSVLTPGFIVAIAAVVIVIIVGVVILVVRSRKTKPAFPSNVPLDEVVL